MLFRMAVLEAIRDGDVTLAYRRWKRPGVLAGTRLRTPVGELVVDSVERVHDAHVTDADAGAAGFGDAGELLAAFPAHEGRALYRVALHYAGADTRIALRQDAELDAAAIEALRARLHRLDRASKRGPWTRPYLELIRDNPGIRAGDLAAPLGVELLVFKRAVRKLKELGLTESLGTGYRISPRGGAYLASLGPPP